MLIERTNREIIIRLPASVDTEDLQAMINYLRYKEITAKVKVPQNKVDALARQVNRAWWLKNRKRFEQ